MHQMLYIGPTSARPDDLRRQLAGIFEIEVKTLETIRDAAPGQYTLVDIDLNDSSQVLSLKEWLRRKPKDAKVIFVTDKASRLQDARACAIGATDVIDRPI